MQAMSIAERRQRGASEPNARLIAKAFGGRAMRLAQVVLVVLLLSPCALADSPATAGVWGVLARCSVVQSNRRTECSLPKVGDIGDWRSEHLQRAGIGFTLPPDFEPDNELEGELPGGGRA